MDKSIREQRSPGLACIFAQSDQGSLCTAMFLHNMPKFCLTARKKDLSILYSLFYNTKFETPFLLSVYVRIMLDEWQTVYALIRRRVMRRLIRTYTVRSGPSVRTFRVNTVGTFVFHKTQGPIFIGKGLYFFN